MTGTASCYLLACGLREYNTLWVVLLWAGAISLWEMEHNKWICKIVYGSHVEVVMLTVFKEHVV